MLWMQKELEWTATSFLNVFLNKSVKSGWAGQAGSGGGCLIKRKRSDSERWPQKQQQESPALILLESVTAKLMQV